MRRGSRFRISALMIDKGRLCLILSFLRPNELVPLEICSKMFLHLIRNSRRVHKSFSVPENIWKPTQIAYFWTHYILRLGSVSLLETVDFRNTSLLAFYSAMCSSDRSAFSRVQKLTIRETNIKGRYDWVRVHDKIFGCSRGVWNSKTGETFIQRLAVVFPSVTSLDIEVVYDDENADKRDNQRYNFSVMEILNTYAKLKKLRVRGLPWGLNLARVDLLSLDMSPIDRLSDVELM